MDTKTAAPAALIIAIVVIVVLILGCAGAGLFAYEFGHNQQQKTSIVQETKICIGDLTVAGSFLVEGEGWIALTGSMEAVSDCFQAVVTDIATFQSQGIDVTLKKAKTTQPLEANGTAAWSNCKGTTVAKGVDHPFVVQIPIMVQVGTDSYKASPSSLDVSSDANIARKVISKLGVPVGSYLDSTQVLSITLPAHTKAVVTVALSLDLVVGTASESNDGVSVASDVSWNYPKAITSSSITGIDVETCH